MVLGLTALDITTGPWCGLQRAGVSTFNWRRRYWTCSRLKKGLDPSFLRLDFLSGKVASIDLSLTFGPPGVSPNPTLPALSESLLLPLLLVSVDDVWARLLPPKTDEPGGKMSELLDELKVK